MSTKPNFLTLATGTLRTKFTALSKRGKIATGIFALVLVLLLLRTCG